MQKALLLSFILCFFFIENGRAQKQKPTPNISSINKNIKSSVDLNSLSIERRVPVQSSTVNQEVNFSNLSNIDLQRFERQNLIIDIKHDEETQLPYFVKGLLTKNKVSDSASGQEKALVYLEELKSVMQIENPSEEFVFKSERIDPVGVTHMRYSQTFDGVKVYGGEIVLHKKEGQVYLFNGRYYPSPKISNLNPAVSGNTAHQVTVDNLNSFMEFKDLSNLEKQLLPGDQISSELVIYHKDRIITDEKLAWHVTAFPNLITRYEYFIDAQTGAVLHKYLNSCRLYNDHVNDHCAAPAKMIAPEKEELKNAKTSLLPPGPETAQATDLQGITRTINVYESGGTFYLIDASRSMHNPSLSQFPNNPTGVIWTLDAFDTYPQNSDFNYDHITSPNNIWNNANGVSAHYNGGVAYQYFKNTFGRESINANGGNIISMINVSDEDGSDFDNAFWNGAAMFYGSGNVAFNAPLAKAVDVAGHELSHGVIQNTANLEYQRESGALNESFADIFGAMMDRNDWKIGEEVANPGVFPSGTMRDMENPNNGGSPSDFYWQPEHVSQQFNGSQDNGGVHINSGIPNHAFFEFASTIGKDKAEQVFYAALVDYLVSSSRFVDLRAAVEEAAGNLYGNAEVTAAQNAFASVGIGGGGTIENTQEDVEVNTGADFILWSDSGFSNINVNNTDGSSNGSASETTHISKPSITDNGAIILYIGEDTKMYEIDIDWSTGDIVEEYVLEGTTTWRNVASSKDGTKLAGLTGNISDATYDNKILVYDFISQTWAEFELFNPTFTEGVTTGDVILADVLEWDHSGQYLLYDAFNSLPSNFGDDITYWDIGFIQVWDDNANNFADGSNIFKLFNGLPENVSVGNPTFSKNSPYIIAFDFIEDDLFGENYVVQGVNLETGDQGVIWENFILGYPNYSINDDQMIFSALNSMDQPVIGIRDLKADKITGDGDASALVDNAEWATWFAIGDRNLEVGVDELEDVTDLISIFPNPFSQQITIEIEAEEQDAGIISIKNILGQELMYEKVSIAQGVNQFHFDLEGLARGAYSVEYRRGTVLVTKKVIKLK